MEPGRIGPVTRGPPLETATGPDHYVELPFEWPETVGQGGEAAEQLEAISVRRSSGRPLRLEDSAENAKGGVLADAAPMA